MAKGLSYRAGFSSTCSPADGTWWVAVFALGFGGISCRMWLWLLDVESPLEISSSASCFNRAGRRRNKRHCSAIPALERGDSLGIGNKLGGFPWVWFSVELEVLSAEVSLV